MLPTAHVLIPDPAVYRRMKWRKGVTGSTTSMKNLWKFSVWLFCCFYLQNKHMHTKLSKMSLYSTKQLKITEESAIPFSSVGECVQFSHALKKTELAEQCLMSNWLLLMHIKMFNRYITLGASMLNPQNKIYFLFFGVEMGSPGFVDLSSRSVCVVTNWKFGASKMSNHGQWCLRVEWGIGEGASVFGVCVLSEELERVLWWWCSFLPVQIWIMSFVSYCSSTVFARKK